MCILDSYVQRMTSGRRVFLSLCHMCSSIYSKWAVSNLDLGAPERCVMKRCHDTRQRSCLIGQWSHSLSFLNKPHLAWDKYDFHCTCGCVTADQERGVAVCCGTVNTIIKTMSELTVLGSFLGRKFELFIENQWNWVKNSLKQFLNWMEFGMLQSQNSKAISVVLRNEDIGLLWQCTLCL